MLPDILDWDQVAIQGRRTKLLRLSQWCRQSAARKAVESTVDPGGNNLMNMPLFQITKHRQELLLDATDKLAEVPEYPIGGIVSYRDS